MSLALAPDENVNGWDGWSEGAERTLVEIVTGGPRKGITDHVESVTAPFDPSDPDAALPTLPESSLDLLLGASVNPAVAQMRGLYWVDTETVQAQPYDYLLIADYLNEAKGNIATIQALVTVSNFDRLYACLKSGVYRSASPPLSPPSSVAGYALPLGAIPTSGLGDVAGQVGLRWDIPVANDSDKLGSASAVLFNVWRTELGSTQPTSPAPANVHHLVTSSPVAAGLLRTQAPDPRLEGWPSVGLFDLDGPLVDGWDGYRASGIDIFGRHSALSDPAQARRRRSPATR